MKKVQQFIAKIQNKIRYAVTRKKQKKIFYSNNLHKSKNLIVFIVPQEIFISGGILSIFNIAKTSRLFAEIHHSEVILATYPGKQTYLKHNLFKNNEVIYDFNQIIKNTPNLEKLIIHIPEYLTLNLYNKLTKAAVKYLKSIPDFQINILNQNIEIMPDRKDFQSLFMLTKNITQTTAHHRYSNEETFKNYGVPMHLIPACIDLSPYKATEYHEKDNLIAYSPDENPHKDAVLTMLKDKLPDYQAIEINGMTFDQYMETITRAKYTISFGEGFDSYLCQPQYVGSVGIAIYNELFFPNREALLLGNVYEDFEEFINKFPTFVKECQKNPKLYSQTIENLKKYCESLYDTNDYQNRIKNFYLKKYDFS